VTAPRILLPVLLVAGACRATPIPEAQRYPAGTSFRAQYRTVDETRLRVIDTGNGTPVVFIHGFGASMYGWRYQLPPIVAAGYRVVAFDNRGFGFSDKPAHGYTNAAYAHLVVSLLDSLGISSAVLTRFRARWITARILRSTFADPSKVTEADVDQYYAPVPDPAYGRALRGVLREFRFDSLGGRLGRVQAPTLILWGDADRWIPLRDGTRFTQELPRSEFVVLTRTGHDAADESPDQVNRYLLAYLKDGLSRIPENVAVAARDDRP